MYNWVRVSTLRQCRSVLYTQDNLKDAFSKVPVIVTSSRVSYSSDAKNNPPGALLGNLDKRTHYVSAKLNQKAFSAQRDLIEESKSSAESPRRNSGNQNDSDCIHKKALLSTLSTYAGQASDVATATSATAADIAAAYATAGATANALGIAEDAAVAYHLARIHEAKKGKNDASPKKTALHNNKICKGQNLGDGQSIQMISGIQWSSGEGIHGPVNKSASGSCHAKKEEAGSKETSADKRMPGGSGAPSVSTRLSGVTCSRKCSGCKQRARA